MINDAIQFGIKVELQMEMRFSGKDLVDMLVVKTNQYQFTHLRYSAGYDVYSMLFKLCMLSTSRSIHSKPGTNIRIQL